MTKTLHIVLVALGLMIFAAKGTAQAPDGLELTLEGSPSFVPGRGVRFFATAFEIRRGELTPAAGALVRALVSHRRDSAAAEVRTDDQGRVVIDIPRDYLTERSFTVYIDVRHAGLQRTFDISMDEGVSPILQLRTIRTTVPLGSPIVVMGRVRSEEGVSGAHKEVRLRFFRERRLLREEMVQTDGEGTFAAEYVARVPGSYWVRASIDGHSLGVNPQVIVPHEKPIVLRVESPPSARPGEAVPVSVGVFDAEGLPVQGALVVPESGSEEVIRTGASGRALFDWSATESSRLLEVRVAGFEPVEGMIPIRVDTRSHHVAARAEHGALIAGVPSYVYLHVSGIDGYPSAGTRIQIRGARLGEHLATTDEQGVARVELTLTDSRALDRCGGSSAVAAEFDVDGEVHELCIPVDADGTLRVRAERRAESLQVRIHRRSSDARRPVVISVFRVVDGVRHLEPIARVVTADGAAELPTAGLASEGGALLEVRARPLVGSVEVRGDLAWVPAPYEEGGTLRRIAVDERTAWARRQRVPMSDNARASDLARRTPLDVGASHVFRDGRAVPQRMPSDQARRGLLRDAHRLQARFQTGRLGLVFRAVEAYIASRGPENVTYRRGRRLEFTAAALQAILARADVGTEGRHDLGGGSLRLRALQAMAPNFDFDHVARRVTRRRLLDTLRAVQSFVRERRLDIPFAHQGTPNDWWTDIEQNLTSRRDGWGRPLRFVRRSSRYPGLDPVRGWELVSAGPDGRYGSGDDIYDPSARVLPRGSLYARATDEEGILRELNGVALGQALLRREGAPLAGARADGFPMPTPLVTATGPTRASLLSAGEVPTIDGHVLEYRYRGSHVTLSRVATRRDPAPALLTSPIPTELRLGVPIEVPITFVGEAQSEGQAASIDISADGIEATWTGDQSHSALSVARPLRRIVRLRGTGDDGALTIRLLSAEGAVLVEERREVRVLPHGIPRSLRAGQRVRADDPWRVRFPLAAPARVRIVALSPTRPLLDPALEASLRSEPAFAAWALAVAGHDPDPDLLTALRETPPTTPIARACALVVWSAIDSDEARVALASLVSDLPDTGANARAAAMLAAVGPIAAPAPRGEDDAVGLWIERLRDRVRRTEVNNTRALGLRAAGLLLADPEERSGLAALAEAPERASMTGFRSLLFSIADHAVGRPVEFDERWMRRREMHAQVSPEAAFWHLAASVYGVFGRGAGNVSVRRGSEEHQLDMGRGTASYSFDAEDEVEIDVHAEGNALVRVEARYAIPEQARDDGPFELELNGEPGFTHSLASFEVVLRATKATQVSEVAINLPAAVQARAAMRALDALTEVRVVRAVPGGLRVTLAPMEAGAELRLPLPLYWVGAGSRRLSIAAWEQTAPWAISATAPQDLEVAENW